MGKYLPDAAQTWGGYAGAALGAALMLWGIGEAKEPDYNINTSTMRAIHEAARDWEGYTLSEDLGGRLQGLALAGVGLGIAGASVAVASAEPSRMVHEADRARDGTAQPVQLPSAVETRDTLITRLQVLLSNEEYLRAMVGAPLLVITGGMGSGKSSAATAIASLRQLLFTHDVLVLDPDLDQNLADGRWTCGDLWGSAQHHGEFKGVWQRLRPRFYAVRQKSEGPQTVIFDEFSKYLGECDIPADEVPVMTAYLKQKIRKMGQRPVLILHSTNAHDIAGSDLWDMPQGDIKSILGQAAVLELEGGIDAWGQPKASGRARFKSPGKPHLTANYKPWSVPNLLLPGKLHKEAQQLFAHVGIKPNFDDGRIVTPEIERMMGQSLNLKDPRNLDRLRRIVEGPSVPGAHESENVSSVDWASIPNAEMALKFVRYLLKKGDRYISDGGDFEVRTLAENWGKNNGFSRPEFKDFLEMLNHFGVGRYTDDDFKRWILTVDPRKLPDEGAD